MLAFLGNIFGTAKAGEKLIDGAVNAVDKLWHTEEEKAEARAEAKTQAYEVYMKWLEATSGSRVARRLLALGAFTVWAVEHAIASAFSLFSIFAVDPTKLIDAAEMFRSQASENNALVGVVFAFYFGGPVLADASKSMLQKWTGTEAPK